MSLESINKKYGLDSKGQMEKSASFSSGINKTTLKGIDKINAKYGVKSYALEDTPDVGAIGRAKAMGNVASVPTFNPNAVSKFQPIPIAPVAPTPTVQTLSPTLSRYNAQVLGQASPTQSRYQAKTPAVTPAQMQAAQQFIQQTYPGVQQVVLQQKANGNAIDTQRLLAERQQAEKNLSELLAIASGVDLMEQPELQMQIKQQQDILKGIDAQLGTMSALEALDVGLSSPVTGIYKAVGGLAGMLGANNDDVMQLAQESQQRTAQAMRDQPIAYGAGKMASDLAGLFIAGEATGEFTAGMPSAFRAAATGAAFEAGQGAGNVLSGEITPKQYARDITRSAIARGGASAIGDVAYKGVANLFRDKEISGLASDFAKRFARSGSYSTSRTALNYLGLSEEQKKNVTPEQLGREFLTDFAYSLADSAIGAIKASARADALMDQYTKVYKTNMKNIQDYLKGLPHGVDEVTGEKIIFVDGNWIKESAYAPVVADAVKNNMASLAQSMDNAYMAGGFAGNEQDYYDAKKYLSAAMDILNGTAEYVPSGAGFDVPPTPQSETPQNATNVPTVETTSNAPQSPQNAPVAPMADLPTVEANVPTEPQSASANDIKSRIINAVRGIRDKVLTKVEPIVISENIDSRLAEDIKGITGIDVNGWSSDLTINGIRHIEKRHGISGVADSSMSDENAYAAIPDIERGYTNIELGNGTRAYRDRDGSKAKTIVLSMPVGDNESFVVEAVPDTDEKTLHVISAYSTKKVANQMPDAVAPSGTPNVVSDATSNENIAPQTDIVNEELKPQQKAETTEANNGIIQNKELSESSQYVKDLLLSGSNKIERDGLEFTLTKIASGYTGRITRKSDGMISNARNNLYDSKTYPTREEAIDDLIGVAERNFFNAPKVEEPIKKLPTAKEEPVKSLPKAERVTNERNERNDNEVSSDGDVYAPSVSRTNDNGLLGGVPAEQSEGTAQPGDIGRNSEGRRYETVEDRGRSSGSRSKRGSDSGSDKGRDLQQETGGRGVTDETDETDETSTASKPHEELTAEETVKQEKDTVDQANPKGNNFAITDATKFPTKPKERAKANLEAVKTIKTIIAENRIATDDERAILGAYTGWGGLTGAFNTEDKALGKIAKELKEILTKEEYSTANGTILDAYFTEPSLIKAMYKGLFSLGFNGGRVLEPSAGVGRFLGSLPSEYANKTRFTAVELDTITGNIAKALYPQEDVRVQGFENVKLPENYIDLVVGNVPFSNSVGVYDKTMPDRVTSKIHNYFIAKSIDSVREGGIVAVITSSGTMDGADRIDKESREYFASKANLIGAIRLPNTAFQTTGTPVITDILIFKKRAADTPYSGEKFIDCKGRYNYDFNHYYYTNEYFDKHPEMVLGTIEFTKGRQVGSMAVTYNPLPGQLSKQIEKAFKNIKGKMDYPVKTRSTMDVKEEIKKTSSEKIGAIYKENGKLYRNKGGFAEEVKVSKTDAEILNSIVEIRDAARELLGLQQQSASDAEIKAARDTLNKLYDAFAKDGSSLHKFDKLISEDTDRPFILSLEKGIKKGGKTVYQKADLFTKNTITPNIKPTHVDTIEEGVIASMNQYGYIDTEYVSGLMDIDKTRLENDLVGKGLAYKDRDGNYVPANLYLSGNVRAKLRDAEALAEGDKSYQKNIEALKKVVPKDLKPEEISVRIGATWIPDSVYSEFACNMLGISTSKNWEGVYSVDVKYDKLMSSFSIGEVNTYLKHSSANTNEWGTSKKSFIELFDALLNNKIISVSYKDENGTYHVDDEATKAANAMADKILEKFQEWMWSDESRRKTYGNLYNEMFNARVTPKFDGSGLTIDGMASWLKLRDHQKNAIQRIISSGGNTLLQHSVGAGKTFAMIGAAQKMRELGLAKKPCIVVPKNKVADWKSDYLKMFPTAKLLVADDKNFSAQKRKQFANEIATGDYDAVILSYTNFEAIPISQAKVEQYYQDQIDLLEQSIEMKQDMSGRNKRTNRDIRAMEEAKKRLEKRMKETQDKIKRDENNIEFEQTGIDALFIDEAQYYKNLFYTTNMSNIADMGSKEGAGKTTDLYLKTQYINEITGGRGITFATATPIMNAMAEAYTMQRYLQPDLLKQLGIDNFDAWASEFAEVRSVARPKSNGAGWEMKSSMSKYKNISAFEQLWTAMTDVVDINNLPDLASQLPKLKGGKRTIITCNPTLAQKQLMKQLEKRSKKVSFGKKGEDNILKIMQDGDKASLTMKLLDTSLDYEEGGKILTCVQNVIDGYKQTTTFTARDGSTQKNGVQLIFCDHGIDGGEEAKRGTNIFKDIKNLLVLGGIPEDEVAFVSGKIKDKELDDIFEKARQGKIRVLIGSSNKMGTGLNVQDRLFKEHFLTPLNRPGDQIQAEGRMIRQGNMFEDVDIAVYVTENMFDQTKWARLNRKAGYINQIQAGVYEGNEVEMEDEFTLSAAEIAAIASGNPLILKQNELQEQVNTLQAQQSDFFRKKNIARTKYDELTKEISVLEQNIPKYKKDAQITGEGITVNGKTFEKTTDTAFAIIAESKKHFNIDGETKRFNIGKAFGFDLYVDNKGNMSISGEATYSRKINAESPQGTYSVLKNMVDGVSDRAKEAEERLAAYKTEIENVKKAIVSDFDKQGELDKAKAELDRVTKELLATNNNEGVPDETDSEEYSKLPNDPAEWTTTRVGDKNKTPMMLSDIIGKMRHDFGISITSGSVNSSSARGQFNKKTNGIRLRSSNDIVTASHEIGHYFDKQYNVSGSVSKKVKAELEKALGTLKTSYSKNKWASEGMAEYIRQYLTNKEETVSKYPEFSDYFLKKLSPEDLALLDSFADEINASLSLDTETAQSSIKLREEGATDFRTIREKSRAKTDYLYQKIVDSNNAIKRFDDEVGSNSYLYATNAAYSDNVAGRILEGNLVDFNGKYVGQGLSTILKGLDTTNKAEYKLFNELLVVIHGPEWIAQGLKVFENPVKNTAGWMENRKKAILADHPEWEAMANKVIDFVDQFQTTWGVDMNLIDPKLYDKLRNKYPNYVPFNRAIPKRTMGGKRTFANQAMPLKRAKGSGLEIIAPVDNIIDMVVSTVNAAIKNNVVVQITNAAEKYEADAGWLEKIPEPKVPKSIDLKPLKLRLAEDTADAIGDGKLDIDNSGVEELDKLLMSIPDLLTQFERGKAKDNVITVLKNGKPEYWKVNDPLLLESLTTLTTPKLNGLAAAYATTTRFLTANITGNNPIWSIFSNAPRDLGTFSVYFKDTKNLPKAFTEIAKSYVSAVKESSGKDTDPYFLEYLAVGGGSSSVYSADTDLAKKMRRKYSAKRSQQLWDKYNPVECISFLSDSVERGPRFAAYKMARLSGKSPQEALYEAMDVTVNFRKAGQVSRTLNKVVPFFNAGVQGTDKMVRFFTASDIKGSERKKIAAKRAGLFLAVGAAIATMLHLINSKDDEEKKNYANLSTYTKNSFFCIPIGDGKYLTIPKPRELAVWTSFAEAMLETYVNKNPHALDEFYDYVAGNIAPSVAEDIIMLPYNISKKGFSEGVKESMYGAFGSLGLAGVVFDVAANRDFLGKPISRVNPYSKKEPKTYYTDSTSQLAYALGQMFNANPQIIDYAGGQTLGYIWKIQKALFPVGEEYRDWTMDVKNTYVRDSQYSTDLVNWLYDEAGKSAIKANTSENISDKIEKLTDNHMTTFYGNFNKLTKLAEDRKARDTMLEMITEYRKAKEDNYVTPVQKAVNNVVEQSGETKLLPSVMNVTIKDKNKKEYALTGAEYIDYQTTYNNLYYDYIEQVLDTTADIDTQIATIKAAKEIANDRATEMFLIRKGASSKSFTKFTDESGYTVPDTAIAKFKARRDLANDDDGSVTQDEIVAEVKKLRKAEEITDHDAYLLFHSEYNSDKNNPWKRYAKPLKKP